MRSEWRMVRVGDIYDTISRTYSGDDKNVVLINTSDVYYGKVLNHKSVPNRDLKGQFKKTFQQNDILYSEIRPINRRNAFVDFDPRGYIASTKLMVLRAKGDKVLPEYMFRFLNSNDVLQYLQSLAETRSGTFPQITFSEIASLLVPLPPLSTQQSIVDTLSCLDAKIDLNNRINENLEAQAQAVFKSWFVDFEPFQDGGFVKSELGFIPEGWRVGKLEEIAQITMGQSPKGTTYNEDGVGEVFYQGRAEFGWRFPSRRLFTTDPKRMAEKNDVLMSVRAPVGDINVANESCCIGRGLASLRNTTYPSFLLYLMHSIKERLNQFNAEGTVFGSINQGSLKSMAVIIPPDNVVYQFENNVASFDQMIWSLSKQNSTLVALRDTLLPKLMSGEIEVPVD